MPTSEWIFEHAASLPFFIVAMMVSFGVVGFSAWMMLRRRSGAVAIVTLRVIFMLLLFWVLLLPARKNSMVEVVKPRFAVLLDTSLSMEQTADPAPVYANRWKAAFAALESEGMKSIASRCLVEVYPFGGELLMPVEYGATASLKPEATSTRLRLALTRLFERLRGQTVVGVLVLSDGIDTNEKSDAWSDGSWPVPLYVLKPENVVQIEEKPDMRIESVDTPKRAVVGWDTQLAATISGKGRSDAFPVVLFRDGKESERIAVKLPAEGGSHEVQFKLSHPKIGMEHYAVRIPPLPDEAQTNDNEMAVAVEVLDAKNRVLFLEDTPRFEGKHFSRALFANRDITPLAFFQMPDKRNRAIKQWVAYGDQQGLSFDFSPDQLRLNKIIVLGDFSAEALSEEHCNALLSFVEQGGSLVLLGGSRMWGGEGIGKTPLAKLLPFKRASLASEQGRFEVSWTAEGRAHPAMSKGGEIPETLPPVLSVFAGADLTGGAQALVTARTPRGEQPILISRMYGQGKVLAVLTDSLWRWQMQPGNEKPYVKFWRYMLSWMSPSASDGDQYFLELFTDAGTVAVGDTVSLQARLVTPSADQRRRSLVCSVTAPDGREIPLTMRERSIQLAGGDVPGYQAEFIPEQSGSYKAVSSVEIDGRKIVSTPCLFSVRATSTETELHPINERVLKSLARASGGRYGEVEAISRELRDLRVGEQRNRRLEYRTAWHSPVLLGILLALLTAEWIVRKQHNMS